MIGGAALLADGIITPPISITSAIEGLRNCQLFANIEEYDCLHSHWIILGLFFFLQQFGTASIGKFFGPIMFIWFTMLAVLGCVHLSDDLTIFKALIPIMLFNF